MREAGIPRNTRFDMKLTGLEKCEYCGLTADTRDHVVPWSFRHTSKRQKNFNDEDCVPACKECNCIAGNKVFETLEDKREYIQARLAQKYRKILALPVWEPEEIAELSGLLRSSVEVAMVARRITELRLRWPYNPYDEAVESREVWKFLMGNASKIND